MKYFAGIYKIFLTIYFEKNISNDEIRTKKIKILTEVKTLIYVIMLLDMVYYKNSKY